MRANTMYQVYAHPRKRHPDILTIGAAIAFMGFVMLTVVVIFFSVAASEGYADSVVTGNCGKLFIAMLVTGAIDMVFGLAWGTAKPTN